MKKKNNEQFKDNAKYENNALQNDQFSTNGDPFNDISQYTALIKMIDKDSMNLAPPNYDLTQKIIIIYGIAANLLKINEQEFSANITPNYIFLNNENEPYINVEKMKNDYKNQNSSDFLFFNAKFKAYLPPEIINNADGPIFEDSEAKMKADIYIFGCICISIMCKAIFNENTNHFDVLDKSCEEGVISDSFKFLIDTCFDEPSKRPTFGAILKGITNQKFINDLERFDVERFKKYQVKVVDKEFIEEIDSKFDITTIPNIHLYNTNDFVQFKYIGKGYTGNVFQTTNKETHEIIAYKQIKEFKEEEDKMRTFREIEILACTNHYAVQRLYGYIKDDNPDNPPAILTFYEKNGSLAKLIKTNFNKIDYTQKFIIMYGIAAGMYYLHTRCILHRDLKPENILINDNMEPLITDFGFSKFESMGDWFQSIKSIGTAPYMAPERINSPIDGFFALFEAKPADVFSFGVIIYYLFSGLSPWPSNEAAQYNIPKGKRPPIPDNFPHLITLLIEACWAQDPKTRPTFEDILHIIGHQVFIQNIGQNIDMERFQDYQRKVLIESFKTDDLFSGQSSKSSKAHITIKGIKFPRIPETKLLSDHDFIDIPSYDNKETGNPFFEVKKVEKDGNLYNQIKIKYEYAEDETIISHLSTQIQVLLGVNHPAFNSLYGVINFTPEIVYKQNAKKLFEIFPITFNRAPALTTPFMKNGNLLTCHSNFTITQKFIILYGIAAGMYYLHKKGMTHLNLKPENILLNDDFEPIINIDITSRPKPVKENLFYLLPAFSFPYVAPELLTFQNRKSSDCNEKKADVYSFSMIVYFLFSGIHPWDSRRGLQPILRKVNNGQRPFVKGLVPSPFDELVTNCWPTNPLKRLSFKNILNKIGSSEFIRSIEYLDVKKFQDYQKRVVSNDFIFPIQICSIRRREEFEITKMIGNGSFGNIMLAYDKINNNNKVVFREIPGNYNDFVDKQKNFLSKTNFPSIISLYGFIEPDGEKKESIILTPYAENGSLQSMIEHEKKQSAPKKWNYTQKCIFMYGVAMGMHKLHSYDITHQNLKPENVLLDENLEPLITDFALLNYINPNQSVDQTASIGSFYMAPEVFIGRKNNQLNYDERAGDVYSFGMLIYFLMTGITPFQAKSNITDLMKKIDEGERPNIPSFISNEMKNLITSCWSSDPSKRPSFQQILSIISYEDFYKSKSSTFNSQQFYDYQIKLGDAQFIKFSDESIRSFQLSGSSSKETLIMSSSSCSSLLYSEQVLIEMAEKGHAESQYRLGCMLRDGEELQQDLENAANYFKKAASQNHIDAIIAYAICLKEGLGVPSNKEEAYRLIQTAIDKDSVDALIVLSSWYSTDYPRSYGNAMQLLEIANEKGHPDASALIGSLIEKRKISASLSKKKVMEYYNKSCLLGSYEGMYHMATFYHYGIKSVVEKNTSEAARLYNLVTKNQCFNHNKNAAVFSLSNLYEEVGEYKMAFNLADFYREKDMFVGYLRCADLYERGVGVTKDEEKARKYLNIAKEKRFKNDQLKIALLYSRAKGVLYDMDKFFYWMKVSAENGSTMAQANLSHYYFKTKKDVKMAEYWAKKSSDAGNQRGMWNLSQIYESIDKDEKRIEYLEKLAKSGYERALVELGIIYKKKNKADEAISHFRRAAEMNLPLGIFQYGNELLHGELLTKNVKEGLKLIEKAASFGCRRAIKKLIDIYSKGIGDVPKNPDLVDHYQKILEQMPKHLRKLA